MHSPCARTDFWFHRNRCLLWLRFYYCTMMVTVVVGASECLCIRPYTGFLSSRCVLSFPHLTSDGRSIIERWLCNNFEHGIVASNLWSGGGEAEQVSLVAFLYIMNPNKYYNSTPAITFCGLCTILTLESLFLLVQSAYSSFLPPLTVRQQDLESRRFQSQ